ncbi:hypothetical protein DSAG12_04540 [Promethearchaeum syntrophicum]|uniref:Uncharacterized protein n=1 Tax=Promethearchaeum syntrophicum TaxID=2594042 RepID=A0AC61ZU44_9ARCH
MAAFNQIYHHSGMIHLLFDPNKIFEEDQPWYPKKQDFIDRNLVRYEGVAPNQRLYWNYPGDTRIELGEYQYYSYNFFTDLDKNELWFNYWHKMKDGYGYDLKNIFEVRLGLSDGFMSNYCDRIVSLFDDAQSS